MFAGANANRRADASVVSVPRIRPVTAEIVVMNREAVAMAADSAVTAGNKIYQSANKLFTLSKLHPVGVLISNNAAFLGVPWETLLKVYREETLGDPQRSIIADYTDHFLKWITEPRFCPKEQQTASVYLLAYNCLLKIGAQARRTLAEKLFRNGRCSVPDRRKIATELLEKRRNELAALPDYQFKGLNERQIVSLYKAPLEQAVKAALDGVTLTRATRQLAFQCGKLAVTKTVASDFHSTLAIAGFGGDDLFPVLEVLSLDGVVGGELRVILRGTHKVSYKNPALLQPLAQSEMVHRFMEGVDATYQVAIERWFRTFCRGLGMNDAQIQAGQKKFSDSMAAFRAKHFSHPIVKTLVSLPKDDMAKMAESLVALTSMKRRVSDELETVADPIDVAVVSKGDGFVWIKRKHYFSPTLNPHFAALYLKGAMT